MFIKHASQIVTLTFVAIFVAGCARTPIVNLFLAPNKDVVYHDEKACVPRKLKRVLNHTSRKFGTVSVTSTKRHPFENRSKGGARNSYHLNCQAVDFAVTGNQRKVIKFLKSYDAVGGYKGYSRHYHIDTGPRRTW